MLCYPVGPCSTCRDESSYKQQQNTFGTFLYYYNFGFRFKLAKRSLNTMCLSEIQREANEDVHSGLLKNSNATINRWRDAEAFREVAIFSGSRYQETYWSQWWTAHFSNHKRTCILCEVKYKTCQYHSSTILLYIIPVKLICVSHQILGRSS